MNATAADFYAAWSLSRTRLLDEIEGLNHAQLNWRLYPKALSIAEGAVHVAGVEAKFAASIDGLRLDPVLDRLRRAATEGVVDEGPFPFAAEELTPEFVLRSLDLSKDLWEPIVSDPNPARRTASLVSALGPLISGEGAMARLAFHSAYHQGQIYQIKHAPGFPA